MSVAHMNSAAKKESKRQNAKRNKTKKTTQTQKAQQETSKNTNTKPHKIGATAQAKGVGVCRRDKRSNGQKKYKAQDGQSEKIGGKEKNSAQICKNDRETIICRKKRQGKCAYVRSFFCLSMDEEKSCMPMCNDLSICQSSASSLIVEIEAHRGGRLRGTCANGLYSVAH